MSLQNYLENSARLRPEHIAVQESSGKAITYRDLDVLSSRLRDRLAAIGIKSGDRVGIYMHKSADGVASIFGILKSGAAYVPVDPLAPAARNAYIHGNCSVKAVIVEDCFAAAHRDELAKLEAFPHLIVLKGTGGGQSLLASLDELERSAPASPVPAAESAPDDLAYILYTSGSTGKPKGVMLSQLNATAFVDWGSRVLQPAPQDRFSSHAPFHFDLSILDIYTPIKHGATLVIVPEYIGKEPVGLAKLISEQRISVWYSAPSILSLLAQFGKLTSMDYSSLRLVLFAGEVFPVVHLRSAKKQWPHPRFLNLYGPTETNVCNYHEIPAIVPEERTDPYPIGIVCEHLLGRAIDTDGKDVPAGGEGELCISGANVMQGYWDMAEQTALSFLPPDGTPGRWYKTGDLVVDEGGGVYKYVGRRDRMIKKRGYRVELGEIEACLYRHPEVREAAVVAVPDEALGMKVTAHLSTRDGKPISQIQLKRFCSENLPIYMIPDVIRFHPGLPKTSTDKLDYQTLKTMA
jgi:amino acid adenylation domain-containing protein